MFKKRQRTKKCNLDQEIEEAQKKEIQDNEEPKEEKEEQKNVIIKGKKRHVLAGGVNPKQLIAIPKKKLDDNNQPEQSLEDMVGMIETKYLKENQDQNEDKLMNKYIDQKMSEKNFDRLTDQQKEEELLKVKEERSKLEEEIYKKEQEGKQDLDAEILSYNQKHNNYMSQGVSTTWQSGIMEIKVSLDQKAENMAKMEEMKRKQLLKGIIVEEDYATRVERLKQEEQIKKNTDKSLQRQKEKEFEEFKQKFYKSGRAYKDQLKENQSYNSTVGKF